MNNSKMKVSVGGINNTQQTRQKDQKPVSDPKVFKSQQTGQQSKKPAFNIKLQDQQKKTNDRPSNSYQTNNTYSSASKNRLKTTLLSKSFDKLEYGIQEIGDASDFIYDLLKKNNDANRLPITSGEINNTILNIAKKNIPDSEKRTNMVWEFKISAGKTTMKTDRYIQFGWTVDSKCINYDKKEYTTSYNFFVMIYGTQQSDVISQLQNAGWGIVPNTKQQ